MINLQIPSTENVIATDDTLSVDLSDGRSISVPILCYPRLAHATPTERNNWRLIGKGIGIRWEGVDVDISVEGFLLGRASGERQQSLARWLKNSRLSCRPQDVLRYEAHRSRLRRFLRQCILWVVFN